MTKKNILLVYDHIEPGGATRIGEDLSYFLKNENVFLLAGTGASEWPSEDRFFVKKKYLYSLAVRLPRLLARIRTVLQTTVYSANVLRKRKIDVIIVNFPLSALGILLNPLSWKIKKIYIFHGAWSLEKFFAIKFFVKKNIIRKFSYKFLLANKIRYLIERLVVSNCQQIWTFSRYSRNLCRQYYQVKKVPVKQIYPPFRFGVNKNTQSLSDIRKTYNPNSLDLIFLVPSRFEPRKGIDVLIDAIKELKRLKTKRSYKFIFTGPKHMYPSYNTLIFDMCEKYNLFDLVSFSESLPRSELFKLYKFCDAVIMPSLDLETFGLTTIEALYAGKAVFGFENSATNEILSQINPQLLVKSSDPVLLAKKLSWFINLPDGKRKHIGFVGKKMVGKYYSEEKIKNAFFESLDI